ncbi:MAG: DUF4340 domain-containing protein [Blastochloris sp.]|nr:DUF4340 domain-containing protein [Blastochloris sp.]
MSTRTTLFLALLTLGLVLYLVLTGWESPGTVEKERQAEKLMVIEAEKVVRLELVTEEGSAVLNKNAEGGWQMESPLPYPADEAEVGSLLSELEFARRVNTLNMKEMADADQALEQFGLKKGRFKITVRGEKKNYILTLGNETARPGLIYALLEDGKRQDVLVIDKALETLLDKPLNAWRTRSLFSFQTADVTAIQLRKDGAEAEIVKEGMLWKVLKPITTMADENEVASYLANLAGATLTEFVSDNAADVASYGLSSPALALDLRMGEKTEGIRLGSAVAGEPGQFYAQLTSRAPVFKISGELVEALNQTMEKLRDRRLVVLPQGHELESLSIEKDGFKLGVLRNTGFTDILKWVLDREDRRLADSQKVEAVLTALKAARATSFLPLTEEQIKKSGLVKPAMKVVLGLKNEQGQTEMKTLLFSQSKKGELTVQSDFRANLVMIPETSLPVMPRAEHEWFGRYIKLANPDAVTTLQWETGNQVSTLSKDATGAWPKQWNGKDIDRDILNQQLNLLAQLPARNWTPLVEKSESPVFMRLRVKSGDKTQMLEVGREVENQGRLARWNGEPYFFEMRNQDHLFLALLPLKK